MNKDKPQECGIDAVLFDFGGVLAEEGYANGLYAIALKHGMDKDGFLRLAREIIYGIGYVTGRTDEARYWQAIRDRTGIMDSDEDLRKEILSRFVPRPYMLDLVKRLSSSGIRVAILSDQTNWLDELNARFGFYQLFDAIYNSYDLGKSKADASQFSDITRLMDVRPDRVVFVDDDDGHCRRARSAGLKAIRYAGRDVFMAQFAQYCRLSRQRP